MLKYKKIIFSLCLFIICSGLFFILTNSIAVATTTPEESGAIPAKGIDLPTDLMITTDIPTTIGRIIKAVLGIVGSIALLMFIYGGFLWLMSAGNPERVTKGKNVLIWATIGLLVIFVSYAAVNFVINSLTEAGEERSKTIESEGSCFCAEDGEEIMIFEIDSRSGCESRGCRWVTD